MTQAAGGFSGSPHCAPRAKGRSLAGQGLAAVGRGLGVLIRESAAMGTLIYLSGWRGQGLGTQEDSAEAGPRAPGWVPGRHLGHSLAGPRCCPEVVLSVAPESAVRESAKEAREGACVAMRGPRGGWAASWPAWAPRELELSRPEGAEGTLRSKARRHRGTLWDGKGAGDADGGGVYRPGSRIL